VRYLSLIQKVTLTCAAVAALAGGRPSLAADPPPRAILDATLTAEGGPINVFIVDGAQEFAAATVGARLLMLEDQTFTITGSRLPTIVGRWFATPFRGSHLVSLWAKTDQINFNGNVVSTPDHGYALQYFVQVNAPRTDGDSNGQVRDSATLKPTSMLMRQRLRY
jgi:hypothetical protein